MYIFEIPGPEFLRVALILQSSCYALAVLLKKAIESSNRKTKLNADVAADCYTAAYLHGGTKHLFLTALKVMEKEGIVEIKHFERTVKLSSQSKPPQNDLEKIIAKPLGSTQAVAISRVFELVEFDLQKSQAVVRDAGLIPTDLQKDLAQTLALLIYCAPIALIELPRFFMGIGNHKPILLLAFLILMSFIGIYSLKKEHFPRTQVGDEILNRWKEQNKALKENFKNFGSSLRSKDLALAIALFAPLSFELLKPMQPAFSEPGGSCSDFSPSCGSSCGGGCGGCGG